MNLGIEFGTWRDTVEVRKRLYAVCEDSDNPLANSLRRLRAEVVGLISYPYRRLFNSPEAISGWNATLIGLIEPLEHFKRTGTS